jgi:hypothetical protein
VRILKGLTYLFVVSVYSKGVRMPMRFEIPADAAERPHLSEEVSYRVALTATVMAHGRRITQAEW